MKTKINVIKDLEKDEEFISEAAEVIKKGGLVAFPTETVYGLGANALDSEAVKNIFIAKGRPQDNPLIIHIADKKDLYKYGVNISDIAEKLAHEFWPGPMTLVVKKNSMIPGVTSANLDTIGIRMPSNKVAMRLIEKSGVAIAAPSANLSGKPSPTDVKRCIEDLDGRVDYILGYNQSEVGVESTIIDVSVNPPCILRPGGITLEMAKKICKDIYIDKAISGENSSLKPKAPGMKYKHYAPKAKVRVVNGELDKCVEKIAEIVHNYIDNGLKVGVMATDETKCKYKEGLVLSLGKRKDLSTVAKNLFSTLREFDDNNVDIIISEAFLEEGLGVAIMNRLKKACGFDIIEII